MPKSCTCRVVASEMDIAAMGHMTGCPLRVEPAPVEVNCHDIWSYKGRRYVVIKVRYDIRIQFNDMWDGCIFYRLASPDNADEASLKFVRAKSDFTAKFRKE